MRFDQLSDESIKKVGERIIRNAEARIRSQVPSPDRNPFSKGALRNSLRFKWGKNSDDEWELTIDYADHGKFVAFGTRSYFDAGARATSFFGRDYVGYVKSTGGIRPQYWLSLRGDRPVYEAIVEAELRVVWETFITNTISDLSKNSKRND